MAGPKWALAGQNAQAIYQQVVVQKLMPMNNATQITDAEPALIGRWFEAGALVPRRQVFSDVGRAHATSIQVCGGHSVCSTRPVAVCLASFGGGGHVGHFFRVAKAPGVT